MPIHIDAAKTCSGFTTRSRSVVSTPRERTKSVAMPAIAHAADGLARGEAGEREGKDRDAP